MIEQAPTKRHYFTYDDAWLYCATLKYKKKYDWRVPTDDEHTYRQYKPHSRYQWYGSGGILSVFRIDDHEPTGRVTPVRAL